MFVVEAIEHYIHGILTPALKKHGVSNDYIKHIVDTVETQIYSCIRHWSDLSFRKALLLLGSEEGPFYEPAGKNDIKCFVVVTVRNSPFETLQSEKNRRKVELTAKERERLELSLIGMPSVMVNEIGTGVIFVPAKRSSSLPVLSVQHGVSEKIRYFSPILL